MLGMLGSGGRPPGPGAPEAGGKGGGKGRPRPPGASSWMLVCVKWEVG